MNSSLVIAINTKQTWDHSALSVVGWLFTAGRALGYRVSSHDRVVDVEKSSCQRSQMCYLQIPSCAAFCLQIGESITLQTKTILKIGFS